MLKYILTYCALRSLPSTFAVTALAPLPALIRSSRLQWVSSLWGDTHSCTQRTGWNSCKEFTTRLWQYFCCNVCLCHCQKTWKGQII